ncbi:MAG: ATP-binding cassette domain-containing protein [Clostridiales bacterium]|nr:ATP-binding cassette domain-containing protein [Clostridiales bacterium]
MKDALKVENLNYKKILKNINFSIKEGTFNILIGPSGSGKTTLLKSVFGLLEYNGVISINDLIVEQKNFQKLRKKIGIYLGIEVLENKSVFLNTIEPLKNLDYKEDISKKKVYSITKKIGIENLLYKEVSELSYSEKKVVAFVQSIIHEPDIILIDNIFDSLDIYYKNKILNYLKQINKKCTILLVTNNTEDLIYADNILILKNGKLNEIGPLEELLKQENIFSKNELKLPFVIDLSYKLNAYDLIDKIIYDVDEMVDEIWR